MSDCAHGDAVVNLENFLAGQANGEKENAVAEAERGDGIAGSELSLDVLAPVRNRFNPAIRFFDHATDFLKRAAIFSSGKVVIPSRETTLMSGYTFPPRSTPPVAVSDSAAVSSARNATVTASSSLRSCNGLPPQ